MILAVLLETELGYYQRIGLNHFVLPDNEKHELL